jgi:hypothetical protein
MREGRVGVIEGIISRLRGEGGFNLKKRKSCVRVF